MATDYKELASAVVTAVGGKENIVDVIHCVTRLRFFLKDEQVPNTAEVEAIPGVLGVANQGGQYQVIIGQEVVTAYNETKALLGVAKEEERKEELPKNPVIAFLKMLTGTITPVIGLLGAAGILKGLVSLLSTAGLLAAGSGAHLMLNALGDSLFYFFPIILGFSAGKKLGANPFIPAIIGGALVYPSVVAAVGGEALTFFGIPLVLMNYTCSVFPVIIAAFLCSFVEKQLDKVLPTSVRMIMTPFITVLVVGIATFLVVGPVVTAIAGFVSDAVLAVYAFSPAVTGLLIGAFWQLLVVFGLHWGLIPIVVNNITVNGSDPLMLMLCVSILCQIGAALGVALKAKKGETKEIAIASTISALFGVTEPTLYSLTLKYRKVLIASCVGGGVAGAVMGLLGATFYGVAGGVFGFIGAISPSGIDISFWAYCIAFAIAVFGTAAMICVTGYEDSKE